MKIAVASKDGISVNLHFGHAKVFWVYEGQQGQFTLLEKREVDHYCHGQHGDQSAMQNILTTLTDCDAVLVAKVGDGPAEKLRAMGIEPVTEYGYEAIDEALTELAMG